MSFKLLFQFFTCFGGLSESVLRSFGAVSSENHLLSNSHQLAEFKKSLADISRVSKTIQENKVQQMVEKYLRSIGTGHSQAGDLLCAKVVSLCKETIIDVLAKLLNYDTDFMQVAHKSTM